MLLAIEAVLSQPEVTAMRAVASAMQFGDGRDSAGRYAREVKANDQARPSAGLDGVLEKVRRALSASEISTPSKVADADAAGAAAGVVCAQTDEPTRPRPRPSSVASRESVMRLIL